MFERFPKSHTKLPDAYQAIYEAHYRSNRDGATAAASLAQRLEAWMHRQVAMDVIGTSAGGGCAASTLEIGAGTLNQLAYEPAGAVYDIVEPFSSLYADSAYFRRVSQVFPQIWDVPMERRYTRITSIATFEHVCDLPQLVARCGLLLDEEGVLRVAIPSEGTLLWTLAWRVSTGLEFWLRHRLDYGVMMRHEHVNTAQEIEDVLRYFFEGVECRVFGLSRSLSLYRYYECQHPMMDRCSSWGRAAPLTQASLGDEK
jgi:hypothetical protein